jgi:hypothetical protein
MQSFCDLETPEQERLRFAPPPATIRETLFARLARRAIPVDHTPLPRRTTPRPALPHPADCRCPSG